MYIIYCIDVDLVQDQGEKNLLVIFFYIEKIEQNCSLDYIYYCQ